MTDHHAPPAPSCAQRLQDLRRSISEITPREAFALQREGDAVVVDVREPQEMVFGSPVGAVRIVRGFLELQIEEAVPDKARTVLVLCGHGVRSLFAAESLRWLGYRDVRSVAGGHEGWRMSGLPVELPQSPGDSAVRVAQ